MKIEGLHEKEIFEKKFPFRLLVNQDIDFIYPSHWHNAVEMIYVVENRFIAFVNSKEYHLREKDILFIPGGSIHEFSRETQTGTRIFINFELSSMFTYEDMNRLRSLVQEVRLIVPEDGELYTSIQAEIKKMMSEHKRESLTSNLYYSARMLDILVLLCKSEVSQVKLSSLSSDRKKLTGLEKINKSFEYIEKNYAEDIYLSDIAKAAGFSEYYFSRLFKEITEKSFHEYLNEFRIKKAEKMLMSSEYSVSEAAYASGFSSISTFDRMFRKMKGCSPNEFRKLKVVI